MELEKVAVVGGAGFIGSHFVDSLLGSSSTQKVVIFDNFSSGRDWHFEHHLGDSRLHVVRGEISDRSRLVDALKGIQTVIHLASNPDIAAAVKDPEIDFREGTALTNAVIEAMRLANVESILYASGSGVYGDIGELEGREDVTPMLPVSTYGASKLAGEALIGSYCYMFDMQGFAFRFGNVVGPRQTHGVGFDFVKRLLANPSELQILGDGKQSKSYIHVEDVVSAVLHVARTVKERFKTFNVATLDYITVNEIADIAIQVLGLNKFEVAIKHTGGDRGWKGDVPIVRLNTSRIRATGWSNTRTCAEAIRTSLLQLLPDAQNGKILRQLSAVFFDRDGVLVPTSVVNGTPVALNRPDEIEFLPGAIELCQKLAEVEVPTFLVTNQPDIARGKVDRVLVEEINQTIARACVLTDVAMCEHDDRDFCECRKPLPGMILDLAKRYSIVLENSFMVGDRWRDIDAGAAAGCKTVFIDYGYSESLRAEPTYKADSVTKIRLILEKFLQ